MTYISVDVDLDDVLNSLSDRDIQYLIKSFQEDGYLEEQIIPQAKSVIEMEWDEIINKLNDGRLRLTTEEESIIKSIANRL